MSRLLGLAIALAAAPVAAQRGEIGKQVPLCKVLSAIADTPCATQLVSSTLVPQLVPVKISGLEFEKTKKDIFGREIDKDFKLSIEIDRLSVTPASGLQDLKVAAHASAEVHITKVVDNDEAHLKDKVFRASLDLSGKLSVTLAPGKAACAEKHEYAMVLLRFTFDGVKNLTIAGKNHALKVPNFLTGSKEFLKLINWGVEHAYKDYEPLAASGLGLCLTKADGKHNCPPPSAPKAQPGAPKKQQHPVVSLGGNTGKTPLCALATGAIASSCLAPIANSITAAVVPIRKSLPKEVMNAEGIQVVAQALKTAPMAGGLSLTAKVALAKAPEPEFVLDASGTLAVAPICTEGSFSLELRPHLTKLAADPARSPSFPKWLLDGIGRTAINNKLHGRGPIEVPLHAKRVARLEKDVSICAITKALLKSASTPALANKLARSVLPIDLRAAKVLAQPASTNATLAHATSDLSLVIKEVSDRKGAGNVQLVRVVVDLRKDKEALPLTAEADLSVAMTADCAAGRNVLVVRPTLDKLQAGRLPPWLLGSTVLDVVNGSLQDPKTACVAGDCKRRAAAP